MLFNSFDFLVFFLVVIGFYYLLPKKLRWIVLLASSYFFYAYVNKWYLLIILFSTSVDFFSSILVEKSNSAKRQKLLLWLSVAVNMGCLFTFKYFDFFIDSIENILTQIGLKANLLHLNLVVPVGISFYTFQSMSYSIDVYRKKIKAEKHFGYFALYISYFPQLLAGPIERAGNLLHRIKNPQPLNLARFQQALNLIAYGVFKKIVVADRVGDWVDRIFSQTNTADPWAIFMSGGLFGVQVYCDFSAYSDMAMGISRLFGIKIMRNFDRPYLVTSLQNHWRKWHISLQQWIRDYMYIPMGGSRKGNNRTYFNIIVAFLFMGVWHGAEWTLILFGLYHGVAMSFERILKSKGIKVNRILGAIATLSALWMGYIMYRSAYLGQAVTAYSRIFSEPWKLNLKSMAAGTNIFDVKLSLFVIVLLALSYILPKDMYVKSKRPIFTNALILVSFIVLITVLSTNNIASFHYFQF